MIRPDGRARRAMVLAGLVLLLISALTAANAPDPSSGGSFPYPPVAPLPSPSLPSWIVQLSPNGLVEPLSQIRVRFAKPVIPLEAIESPDEQTKLKFFEIAPALPGTWRFVTPHMAVFELNRALNKATRIRVTIKAGLSDLAGDRLAHDIAWTFETEHIAVAGPVSTGGYDIKPVLGIYTNVEIDTAALRSRTRLVDEKSGQVIPISVEPWPSSSPTYPRPFLSRVEVPQEKFQAHDIGAAFQVKPLQTLHKNWTYRLSVASGLPPAYGNIPSTDPFSADLTTYAPLVFYGPIHVFAADDTSRASERFDGGTIALVFNNPIDEKSARANISISPAPASGKGVPDLFAAIGDQVVLNPWALKPDTQYKITIKSSLRDKWGQSLGNRVVASSFTDDIAADFSTLDGWRIFPATLGLKLTANVLSLPGDKYQAAFATLKPEALVFSAYEDMPDYTNWHISGVPARGLPPVLQWPNVEAHGTRNNPSAIDLGLSAQLRSPFGALEYGMTARIRGTLNDMPNSLSVTTGRINVTNLGLFAQVMPHEAVALVHRLSDGAPVRDALVQFFVSRSESSGGLPAPCATAKTDTAGMATLDAAGVRRCEPWHGTRTNEYLNGPHMLVVARSGADWTAATISQYGYSIGAFQFGWDESPIISRGSMFSDRGLYQPGEKASFEAYAFHLQDGVLERDDGVRFTLTLRSPDGTEQVLGSRITNEFGAFPFDLVVSKGAPLGYYRLIAKSAGGVELDCQYRVAEFKAPNFKVSLAVDREIAIGGDTVNATGQSDYLFGQPVDGAKTRVSVSRSQTSFVPHGWEDKGYSWGVNWWPQPAPTVSPEVLDVKGATDVHGATHQPIPVATDLPFALAYRAELTTTDASNLAVAGSTGFTALPSPVLIGLDADYLNPAAKPLSVKIVTTDPLGAQISGRAIHVSLSRISWDNNDKPIFTVDGAVDATTNGNSGVNATLIPKLPGWYRLSANFSGAKNRATETDRDVWVYGPGEVTWSNNDDGRSVELKLDRDVYEPGDRATVLVKSSFADADLYLAVIRHGTLWRTFEHVTGNAPALTFTVTREMLPGAQIEAVLVRRGQPIETLKPGSVKSIARFGNTWLAVNLDRRYLKVVVKPQRDRLEPGRAQTVDLQLRDYAGNPVAGQLTVMVADESILQLNGYRPPDLVHAVYSNWPVSAQAGDNRLDVALSQPLPAKLDQPGSFPSTLRATDNVYELQAAPIGTPIGAMYSVNAAKTLGKVTLGSVPNAPLRVDFQQLAYFNGDVRTDGQGHATITFKAPDNLTTWRVLAVAAGATPTDDSSNFRFGNGDATFITTRPLLANPLLPQFARPGDIFFGGLATNNTTGASGTMMIDGSLTGALVFQNGGRPSTTISSQFPAAAGTQSQRFPMDARALGDATVQFRIALGETGDAFRVPFTVMPLDITESVVETGATTTGATIPLSVDPNVDNFAGGLQITMASTLLPEILVPAKDCFLFEYLPFAEPLSSRLMVAADMRILNKKYQQSIPGFDPVTEAGDDLVQLKKLQRMDGGFGWWPGDGLSNPYLTGYAAQALGRVQQSGLNSDAAMVAAVHSYLTARIDDPDPRHWCFSEACIERMRFEAMLGLAALGDVNDKHMAEVYAQRDNFDLVSRIELARYMTALPAWETQADEMAKKIQELVYETGRYAVLNTPEDMWWFDSITKGQAETVRLYVAQRYDAAITDRMVRSLLALRRKGSWANTYDDAQALNALIEYAGLEPEPPAFTATAMLKGTQIVSATFNGYRDSVRETYVATSELPRDRSDLVLSKGGTGTLHYVVSYSYRLHGPQPGAEAGLLVSRDVRRVGKDDLVAHMGLTKPAKSTTLPSAQVYDVGLTITVDHPVNQVIIVDPLAAGMEAVDTTFNTTPQSQTAQYGAWQIDYQVIHHDRVVAFANYLAPGIYTMHYLARTITPGTYEWPGTQAYLEYAPEEFGRAASTTLTIP